MIKGIYVLEVVKSRDPGQAKFRGVARVSDLLFKFWDPALRKFSTDEGRE